MAGMKESPRQRLIGMMYLVLTALLALQVSSTIIEKFLALNDNMEQTVAINSGYNADKLQSIKLSVERRGNKEREVALLKKTENLHQETLAILKYMESLKAKLIEDAGGRDEEGNLTGAKEETAVEVYMLGSDLEKGKAYELKARLDKYNKLVKQHFGNTYASLAPDGHENNLYKNSSEHRNKDFAQLNFGQTPLAAALAVLSEIETKLVAIENDVLVKIADQIEIKDVRAGKIFPVVRATRYVPAGTPYEADVFLSATLIGVSPTMNAGAAVIPVNSDGVGHYKFMASGGNYGPDGTLKKSWTANIKVKNPDGTDSILQVKEDYVVVKPVVQFGSVTEPTLYKNCGNKLNVQVPALGAYYNPDITADGAVVKKLAGQGKIMVIPQGSSVKLRVKNQGQLLEEKTFNIRLIPKPKVEVRVNDKVINPLDGIDAQVVRKVSVKIIADPDFKTNQPEDSYYEVVEWRVRAANGRRVDVNAPVSTPVYNFQKQLTGNKLLVEVIKVRRKTYLGQWEEVNMPNNPIIIPMNN